MTQPPAPAPVSEGRGEATQKSAVASHPTVSIVVPTYNERERLEEFVRAVFRVLSARGLAAELVIVDDKSPDGTGALADRLARDLPIRVVHRPGKLGLGGAVMAGFAAATGDVLGVMDADLSHPPEAIPAVIRALEETGADIVVASRYVPGGGTRNWPLSRAVMSKAACLLARPLTPVRDAASGFFVLRREALRAVDVKATGFKICLELLVRSPLRSIVELPYVFTDRAEGASKMNVAEALGYLMQVWDLFWWRRRQPPRTRRYRRLAPEEVARFDSASG